MSSKQVIEKLPVAYFAIIERKDKAYAAFSNDGNHTGDCIFPGMSIIR